MDSDTNQENQECSSDSMTFADHKELTAKDCEAIAGIMNKLAKDCREGNMDAFKKMWITGGTEGGEGDAKINALREMIVLRYLRRAEEVQ